MQTCFEHCLMRKWCLFWKKHDILRISYLLQSTPQASAALFIDSENNQQEDVCIMSSTHKKYLQSVDEIINSCGKEHNQAFRLSHCKDCLQSHRIDNTSQCVSNQKMQAERCSQQLKNCIAQGGDRTKWYWTKWHGQIGSNFYAFQFN